MHAGNSTELGYTPVFRIGLSKREMMRRRYGFLLAMILLFVPRLVSCLWAQELEVVPSDQLPQVVPTGFYYEGQVAPTQMRNAAAVRIGAKKHVIVALVDNSGYAAETRSKIEGFWATDLNVRVGGKDLPSGVYPFGVTRDGILNIYNLSGILQISVKTTHDALFSHPRPLVMVKGSDGIRLYRGRDYVLVKIKK